MLRALPLLVLAACSGTDASIPRLSAGGGAELDPLVAESIELALARCDARAPGALLELAKCYEANGLGELAARAYALCQERGGEELGAEPVRVAYHRACSLEQSQQAEAALRAFEEVRRLAPDYAPVHWRAGNLWLEQGDGAAARRAFERALELEPRGVPQRLGLARVQLFEGQAAAAIATLEPLAAERPRERFVHGLLARARRALGDEAGARAELAAEERAQETNWTDPWAAEVLKRATGLSRAIKDANELLLAGNARGAMELLEPLHQRVPDNLPLLQLLVKACIEAGELERAAERIARGRTRFPGQYKLELYAGQVALARRNFKRAKQELESSLALNPAFGPTLAALGEVEFKLGSLEAAERAFERALQQGESDLRTRILYAQVELQLQRFERARELLEAARADFPQSVVPLAHLAEVHARSGKIDEARAALAEAERIDPSFAYLARVREVVETSAR